MNSISDIGKILNDVREITKTMPEPRFATRVCNTTTSLADSVIVFNFRALSTKPHDSSAIAQPNTNHN